MSKCWFNLGCKVVCAKCRKRHQRKRSPLKSTYMHLKENAKRRHIPFSLTIVDWLLFCERTGYLEKRGIYKGTMQVDRIKVVNDDGTTRGYDVSNIQMITMEDNIRKRTQDQRDKYSALKDIVRRGDPDVPF